MRAGIQRSSVVARPGRAIAWLSSRPALAAAAIYAVLSVLMFAQGLAPGHTLSSSDYLWSAAPWTAAVPPGVRPGGSNSLLNDSVVQFQPFLLYSRSVLPHVPLWNPYIGSGRPFLADAQSAVFSPFNLPAYVLPFWRSLAIIAALKLFVAAFGSYLLGRGLGMRFGGALLVGVVFGFGQFIVAWVSWPQSSVWVLIPWLLLMTEKVVRRPRPLTVAGLAAAIGLQYLAGHPESSFHALFATAAFFVLRAVQTRSVRRMATACAAFGAALLIGTAVAAIVLVPFIEALRNSDLVARRAAYAAFGAVAHQPPSNLLMLFFPDYWGRATQTLAKQVFVQEVAYYAGALTLILAVAALVLRPAAERIAVAGFGAFSLSIAVGIPPMFGLVTSLPGFHTARNDRIAVLFLLCVALLAGWGLDELSGPGRLPRQRLLLALSAALVCLPPAAVLLRSGTSLRQLGRALEVASGFAKPASSRSASYGLFAVTRLAAVLEWVIFAGAGLALVTARARHRLAGPALVLLAVALIVVDLFKVEVGFNPAIPMAHAIQPTTGAIRYLQSRRPNRFVGVETSGSAAPLPPNIAMKYGLYDARAYDYPEESRYDRIWTADLTTSFDGAPIAAPATPRALSVLRLLSVADLLQSPSDAPLHLPGVRLAYSGADARVYAYTGALPRVFVVDRQQVVASANQAMTAVTAPQFDGRNVAVAEHAIPGLPTNAAGTGRAAGQARLTSYAAERVVAATSTIRPGMLVLTDDYYPGWKASVDGRPARIYRVDYLLRGVRIPAGAHTVVFTYQPASWRRGWIISAAALITLFGLALVGLWQRRRAHAASYSAADSSLLQL